MKEENYELYIKRFESERLKSKTEREKLQVKTERGKPEKEADILSMDDFKKLIKLCSKRYSNNFRK